MSISSAFNSALSGLAAAGRASDVAATNIANAMTEGFARRELRLGSVPESGSGVRMLGVVRVTDTATLQARRMAEADHLAAADLAGFHARVESLVGTPDQGGSLSARLAEFEASLLFAASRPDSEPRLQAAVDAARSVAGRFNAAARGIDTLRADADRAISVQVERLNSALRQVQDLNTRITALQGGGGESAALLDQRQSLVDEINIIVPVRELRRDHGQLALYSEGGVLLVDGPAARFDFSPANLVTAEMRVENGALSGLAVSGFGLRTDGPRGPIAGGTLAAAFAMRDTLGPEALARLDAAARDLADRLAAPDATLGPGMPGLLTDAGAAPGTDAGLAGRLRVNGALDPAQGGEAFRLRAGIAAAAPGEPGNAALLNALTAALAAPAGDGRTAGGHIADLSSWAGSNRVTSERMQSFTAAGFAEIRELELGAGVDTDAEVQALMLIEQTYAANARVIQTVDDMMSTLLRL